MKPEEKFIDLDRLIASKNPRLAKWAPRFLINYLNRILHVEEVNLFLHENRGDDGFTFARKVLDKFNITVESHGMEHIPSKGGVVIAMNHPLGGMDAMAVIDELRPIRTDFKFVVNDVLLQLENLKGLFAGVNTMGSNTREALRELNELYEADQAVLVFPSGMVSRKRKGVVADLEWKKTFITQSRKHKKNVIPLHIEGQLSNFFYRLANFRTGIGLKANIEMLYLVDELFRQEGRKMTLTAGTPISYETFDRSRSDHEWAQWVRQKLYELPQLQALNS